MPRLDINASMYLLFSDGKLFDYHTGTVKKNDPALRLFRHCDVPAPPIEQLQSQPLWQKGLELADHIHRFYKAGGVDLTLDEADLPGDDHDDGMDGQRRTIADLLAECQSFSPVLDQP